MFKSDVCMKGYRLKFFWGLAMATFAVLVLAWVIWGGRTDSAMIVRFLDVGQGDSILISQGSTQVLIDGGRDPKRLLELLGSYMPFWDRTLDIVVATHPDEDHIGGLVGLPDRYHVGQFLQTNESSETQVFSRYREVVKEASAVETFAPLSVVFPVGARLDVLYPEESINVEEKMDSNATSIVMKLTYGKHSFLFTGDLPDKEELDILVGDIEVLKVGHHGSKHSTSDSFLDRITPEYGILSVGAKNRYGHPAPEVVENLKVRRIDTLRTDEKGTIAFVCKDEQGACEVVTEK